uniref:NADH-ubiquinone oxidoreductase chain 6 n=1 Tax=Dalcantha cf. alata YW-2018 TaxID=2080380 RepID=A0A2P1CML0_9HEMI|nr:NADH dehydrogenase subunit 6 [Dalcantha cf. alata YW-2018]
MSIMYTLMVTMSIMFLCMKHPLSMGFMMICQTIIIALLMGVNMKSFLLSYIIIMIMLSGMLVLFIYMASVASNEKFQTPFKLIMMFLMLNFVVYIMIEYLEINDGIIYSNNMMKMDEMNMIKLFNTTSGYIIMMMIMYLLLSMIIVSNMAPVQGGPLRNKL